MSKTLSLVILVLALMNFQAYSRDICAGIVPQNPEELQKTPEVKNLLFFASSQLHRMEDQYDWKFLKLNKIATQRIPTIATLYHFEVEVLNVQKQERQNASFGIWKTNELNQLIYIGLKSINPCDSIKQLVAKDAQKVPQVQNVIQYGIQQLYRFADQYDWKFLQLTNIAYTNIQTVGQIYYFTLNVLNVQTQEKKLVQFEVWAPRNNRNQLLYIGWE